MHRVLARLQASRPSLTSNFPHSRHRIWRHISHGAWLRQCSQRGQRPRIQHDEDTRAQRAQHHHQQFDQHHRLCLGVLEFYRFHPEFRHIRSYRHLHGVFQCNDPLRRSVVIRCSQTNCWLEWLFRRLLLLASIRREKRHSSCHFQKYIRLCGQNENIKCGRSSRACRVGGLWCIRSSKHGSILQF